MSETKKTEILAPAGSRAAFLAALAAGADAVYCGLKQFSARMEAKNFSFTDLAVLTRLAHRQGTRVYVAFNTLVRPDELEAAGRMLAQLAGEVKPDALIIQDLGLMGLARQAGYAGELYFSTLANVTFKGALDLVHKKLGIDRVVLPRELSVDEIKALAGACPAGMGLETFIHGALCYGVSGRCYWSSYLGGRSSLRGRCVQPCRRRYAAGGESGRLFSCQDFSLDVLVKVLKSIPEVVTWKIEGRKKGPHYVYYTVLAYKMLRDEGQDPAVKKAALELLSLALGRPGTHYNFLPQRPQAPVKVEGQTGSGLLVGRLQGGRTKPYITAREELFKNDVLRIGYEDDKWHAVRKVSRHIPKRGRLYLKIPGGRKEMRGTPVFLIDRKEAALERKLAGLEKQMEGLADEKRRPERFSLKLPRRYRGRTADVELHIRRQPDTRGARGKDRTGLWLSDTSLSRVSKGTAGRIWWCLPPVVWPDTEAECAAQVRQALKKGARTFLLNAPWQTVFFPSLNGLHLWAGPFCNIANPLAVDALKRMGFTGAVVSPEMGAEDLLAMPKVSSLPLGIVLAGTWPLCISRTLSSGIEQNRPFSSPRGEQAWAVKNGHEYWLFPNWALDLSAKREQLYNAGYRCFVELDEPIPAGVRMKPREGLWNWKIGLK
ncbi:MAG: U32 family peptidase [Deltaproteobacteria bacterium]|nr:U32 family peptidase [Deltaproteobacteria bacterium]